MFAYLKRLKRTFFAMPTPLELATQELAESELKLLEALTGKDFAESQVTYEQNRQRRLNRYINEQTEKPPQVAP